MCCDCGTRLKNRGRNTKRCSLCNVAFRRNNAHGRITGHCSECSQRLTLKLNKTGLCVSCWRPKLRGKRVAYGRSPWNSGVTIFASEAHKRVHQLARRRARRKAQVGSHEFVSDRLRTLIRNSLRRVSVKKTTKTATLIGCSTDEFKTYLEVHFVSGMTWNNYGLGDGRWNIDHTIPLSAFNLSEHEQQLKAFHYSNCRPMWAEENLRKGDRYPYYGYRH